MERKIAVLAAIGLMVGVATLPASADEYENPGTNCGPYNENDSSYKKSWNYGFNTSAASLGVYCPINHNKHNITGTAYYYVDIHDKHPSQSVSCYWHHETSGGSNTYGSTVSTGTTYTGRSSWYLGSHSHGAGGHSDVYCALPAASGSAYSSVHGVRFIK